MVYQSESRGVMKTVTVSLSELALMRHEVLMHLLSRNGRYQIFEILLSQSYFSVVPVQGNDCQYFDPCELS